MPEAGLEPARRLRAKDFESFVSTISPLGRDEASTTYVKGKGTAKFVNYQIFLCIFVNCMDRLKIYVEDDFSALPSLVAEEKELFLVFDSNVRALAEQIESALDPASFKGKMAIISSETAKNMDTVMSICDFLLEHGASRNAFVMSLGGGITSDMAGFAASIYKRGVRFAHLPTTLLAQVDAAIGGKTGVNFHSYKNLLGVINQPEFTYISSGVLATLPARDYASGAAEMLKTFVIADSAAYASAMGRLRAGEPLPAALISAAAGIKAGVVRRDERESGERRHLNLGHTVAHAIEWWQESGVGRTSYSHGEAVAIGMVAAARLSEAMGVCPAGLAARIEADLQAAGLPTVCPIAAEEIASALRQDKKAVGDSIWFVLIREIGSVEARFIPLADVVAGLRLHEAGFPQPTADTKPDAGTQPKISE